MAAVIKELQELHASGRYSKQQCYDLQGEINYFTANQQRMDYPLYRSCGLPIGISSRGGLQERGRQAHETERDDLVAYSGEPFQ